MGTRRKGREAALQMLYQLDLARSGPASMSAAQVIQGYWATLAASAEGREFADEIVRGCAEAWDDIDGAIRSVSEHWRLERMTRVDRSILRMATFELKHLPAIPRRVTLNEAIELAKRYGSEGSPGFVNGVLDRIAGDLDKD